MVGKGEAACRHLERLLGPHHFLEDRLGVRGVELEVVVAGEILHLPLAGDGVSLVHADEVEVAVQQHQRSEAVAEEGVEGARLLHDLRGALRHTPLQPLVGRTQAVTRGAHPLYQQADQRAGDEKNHHPDPLVGSGRPQGAIRRQEKVVGGESREEGGCQSGSDAAVPCGEDDGRRVRDPRDVVADQQPRRQPEGDDSGDGERRDSIAASDGWQRAPPPRWADETFCGRPAGVPRWRHDAPGLRDRHSILLPTAIPRPTA